MHEITSQLINAANFNSIKCVHGYEKIKTDFSVYLTDESKYASQPFDYLFFPRNENELASILQEMSKQDTPVTIASARTGLVGGSAAQEGALISLEHLDQIKSIFRSPLSDEWIVRAQTSLTLKALDEKLRMKNFPGLENSPDNFVRQSFAEFKADSQQYFYPPDPTEMSAALGGTVVTNASGARTYRYGPTRAWIRGIRVCLANGEFIDIPRGKYFASPAGKFVFYDSQGNATSFTIPNYELPRTKSTTGIFTSPQMDLIDLFIGSEGIFGIITQVDAALLKREEKISIIQFLESDEQAIELTEALRSDARLQLDFLEFYSGNALDLLRKRQAGEPSTVGMPPIPVDAGSAIFFELGFDQDKLESDHTVLNEIITNCGGSLDASWAGYEAREMDRFKVFRHLVPETINSTIAERRKTYPKLHKLGTDLAVPDQHLAEIWKLYKSECDAAGLEWLAFGHIGNNHVHVNIIPRDMQDLEKGLELYTKFAEKTVEFGGAVSAEHGVGKLKQMFMQKMYNEDEIGQMKAIKKALDPLLLLNPDVIFPRKD